MDETQVASLQQQVRDAEKKAAEALADWEKDDEKINNLTVLVWKLKNLVKRYQKDCRCRENPGDVLVKVRPCMICQDATDALKQ